MILQRLRAIRVDWMPANAAGSTSRPGRVIRALDVRPGMLVGDLGPGVGHFTFRLARAVEPAGVVYALEPASQRTLDELMGTADEEAITTLRTIKVPRDRLQVPEPVISSSSQPPTTTLPNRSHYLRRRAFIFVRRARRSSRVTTRGFAGSVVPHASSPSQLQRERTPWVSASPPHDIVRGYFFGLFEVAADPARASK